MSKQSMMGTVWVLHKGFSRIWALKKHKNVTKSLQEKASAIKKKNSFGQTDPIQQKTAPGCLPSYMPVVAGIFILWIWVRKHAGQIVLSLCIISFWIKDSLAQNLILNHVILCTGVLRVQPSTRQDNPSSVLLLIQCQISSQRCILDRDILPQWTSRTWLSCLAEVPGSLSWCKSLICVSSSLPKVDF